MISLRAALSLVVICSAMVRNTILYLMYQKKNNNITQNYIILFYVNKVLTDCTDMREIMSTLQENPLSVPFPDYSKILNFPQEFPFPCLKDFPGSIVPPISPFSQLNNCFSSEPLASAPETPPAEDSTY